VLVSCKATYRRIDINSIPEEEKTKVYNFGMQVLKSCKTRQFIQLSGRKVTKNLENLSVQEMQYVCDVLDKTNGKIIDMKLVEVIEENATSNSKIYRYKGNFERNDVVREIRIWLGTDEKFQGIICKTWKDGYEAYKKE
jgi:hypothetical protein